jgi:hypothetical protein
MRTTTTITTIICEHCGSEIAKGTGMVVMIWGHREDEKPNNIGNMFPSQERRHEYCQSCVLKVVNIMGTPFKLITSR